MVLVRNIDMDMHSEKVPYKVIETIDEQKPFEFSFDKAPSADVKATDDPKNIIKIIEIEEGVTTIGYDEFHGYRSLVSVKLPSTLKNISADAFIVDDIEKVLLCDIG